VRTIARQDELAFAMVELQAESRAPGFQEAQGFGDNLDVPRKDAIIQVKGGHVEGLTIVCGELAELFYDRVDGEGKQQWSQRVTLLDTSSGTHRV